jgi:hypothetical protein
LILGGVLPRILQRVAFAKGAAVPRSHIKVKPPVLVTSFDERQTVRASVASSYCGLNTGFQQPDESPIILCSVSKIKFTTDTCIASEIRSKREFAAFFLRDGPDQMPVEADKTV